MSNAANLSQTATDTNIIQDSNVSRLIYLPRHRRWGESTLHRQQHGIYGHCESDESGGYPLIAMALRTTRLQSQSQDAQNAHLRVCS